MQPGARELHDSTCPTTAMAVEKPYLKLLSARAAQSPKSRAAPRLGQALLPRGQQPRQRRHRRLVPDDENRVRLKAGFGVGRLPDGALASAAI